MKPMHIICYCLLYLAVLFPLNAIAQNHTIRGKVVDKATQETLIGVNIIEKMNNQPNMNGTVTDMDGNFTLTVNSPKSILSISYIGYEEMEIPVNDRQSLTIEMTSDTQNLDEIVVIGYGSVKKKDLTGSVGILASKELSKISTAQPTDALQGKVSGLTVIQGGAPGAAPMIKIRGIGTTNNSDPLYVVDGVLIDDALFVSNEDIESMQVLKDASATSIYGSRGANGVIIITTKKGKVGKTKFSFSGYEGIQKAQREHIDMCNATEFATLYNEAAENSGIPKPYNDPSSFGQGTDWLDEITRTASVRNYSLSASGGSEKITYSASVSYFNQDGVQKKSDYERLTLRLNNVYRFNKNVILGHNLSYIMSESTPALGSAIQDAYRMNPTMSVYDENGNFTDTAGPTAVQNVAANIQYHNEKTKSHRLVGDFYLEANFLKDFTFKSSMGFDVNNTFNRYFRPEFFISTTHKSEYNELRKTWGNYSSWLWENTLTYDKTFAKDHHINVLAGYTMQEFNHEDLSGYGKDIPNQELEEMWYLNNIDKTSASIGNGAWSSSMMSYLFRVNYSYKDKYLATATIRADGSSKFGPDNRWGYFPSFALAWRIKEESFLKDVDVISNLKLRGSWGQIGNDKIGNYRYYPLVYRVAANCDFPIGGIFQTGATIVDVSNKNLHWEKTTQLDLGIDLGLFNNRLNLEFDYYNRITSDMLVVPPVPAFVGASTVEANVGKVKNHGFDISLSWRDRLSNGMNYEVRMIGSHFKNKVLELADNIFRGGNLGSQYCTFTDEGMAMSTFWGYKIVGVYQNQQDIDHYNAIDNEPTTPYNTMYDVKPGDFIYADVNGDGKINADDKTDLGSPFPTFTGSFGFSLDWKGFDFSIDLYASLGNKIFNGKIFSRESMDNFDKSFMKRWTGEGTDYKNPRLTLSGNNWEVSEYFLENGSYCKIQNITIGYTLPKTFTKKFRVDNLRFYISGNDLKYFTKYRGFTPEIGGSALSMGVDTSYYPVSATYRVGMNINF